MRAVAILLHCLIWSLNIMFLISIQKIDFLTTVNQLWIVEDKNLGICRFFFTHPYLLEVGRERTGSPLCYFHHQLRWNNVLCRFTTQMWHLTSLGQTFVNFLCNCHSAALHLTHFIFTLFILHSLSSVKTTPMFFGACSLHTSHSQLSESVHSAVTVWGSVYP